MDTQKVREWLEVIGIFSVVASLVFVGMQMQQDREIARVMIYQSRASTLAEILMTAAGSPESLSATIKSSFGDPNKEIQIDDLPAPITGQDLVLGAYQAGALLAVADNSFYQYQEGFLPSEHWASVRSTLVNTLASGPFLRFRFEGTLEQQRPAFRDELIDILRDAEAETLE